MRVHIIILYEFTFLSKDHTLVLELFYFKGYEIIQRSNILVWFHHKFLFYRMISMIIWIERHKLNYNWIWKSFISNIKISLKY